MSIKHALVVDDSKSAQFALKKQLETHGLAVSLADSGEAALEFLEHEIVDVIFMDHTMPGMDGLQALAAIKRNPRTAMIPVMMYTTKEGEVYVGQARALGGIGVLPKEVHPQVLFDMLLKLGLVEDKRSRPLRTIRRPRGAVRPTYPKTANLGGTIDRHRVAGAGQPHPRRSVGAARGVPQRTRRARARSCQRGCRGANGRSIPSSIRPARHRRRRRSSTMLIGIDRAVRGRGADLRNTRLERGSCESGAPRCFKPRRAAPASPPQTSDLVVALHTEQTQANARYLQAIDTLQWAMNQNASAPFDELAFDDARIEQSARCWNTSSRWVSRAAFGSSRTSASSVSSATKRKAIGSRRRTCHRVVQPDRSSARQLARPRGSAVGRFRASSSKFADGERFGHRRGTGRARPRAFDEPDGVSGGREHRRGNGTALRSGTTASSFR